MNRHPEGEITTDWQLNAPGVVREINANLDGSVWIRSHLPDSPSWLRSRSATLTGDLVVAFVLAMVGVSAQYVIANIRKTWLEDMQNKLKIRDCIHPPIHGAIPGDEPLRPPTTMFAYYYSIEFQILHIASPRNLPIQRLVRRQTIAKYRQIYLLHLLTAGSSHSAIQMVFPYALSRSANPQ